MKKIYMKVEGMMCNHCYQTVAKAIKNEHNVKKVKIHRDIVNIWYENDIDFDKIITEICERGYITKKEYISNDRKKIDDNINLPEFIMIFGCIILIINLLNKIAGFNIFNVIPTIDTNIQMGMLFLTGLCTSIHCISMCGAINLYTSASKEDGIRKFKNPLLYNIGRLVSYTALGGIIGGIGNVFSINYFVQNLIILAASILMLLMSLSMLGIITISGKIKECKCFKTKNPFFIGILNGFMPCGPLQAMQVYALSTASFFYGAVSMFLFCLGTIPLMLVFGTFVNACHGKAKIILNKIASVLVLILSLVMLERAFTGFGIDFNINKNSYSEYKKAILNENYQYVEFDLDYGNFADIIVQKNIPVKMIINADKKHLNGCNNEIIINEYGVNKKIEIGKNEIEFIPTNEGDYLYCCWMNMIKNKIKVIDDEEFFKEEK